MAEQEWAGTTYGNAWMHKWLIRMLRHIDVRILYLFVALFIIPVCLILNPSRGIAYRYFRRRIGYGRMKSAWKTYTNHCLFGQVVVDRFAMYAGKRFDVEVVNYNEFLERASRKEEGFVQLSAHVGNYEIAGYTLVCQNKRLNALVFAGEKASVMQNRSKMFADTNINMIAIQPDMTHLFEIDKALADGEIVSMPADRINGSQKSIEHEFLGAKAKFPLGPFSVATMSGLDVLAVNVMKDSLTCYKIYVTPLLYDKGATRQEQIKQLSEAYVAELEKRVRQYPEQWYNYFEFWEEKVKSEK